MKTFLFVISILLTTTAIAINPHKDYKWTPDSLQLDYENIQVKTPDNYSLNVWKILPEEHKNNKTTIILAYGDAGNMSYYLYQVKEFIKSGFTVVMFDYRGFGKSSSFDINKSYLYYEEYATDLISIIKWSKKEMSDNKFGIWAISMGTIISTIAINKESIDFYIAEGTVYNPVEHAKRIQKQKNKKILLPEGANKLPYYYKNISPPMLIFSGKTDKITPIEDCNEICNLGENRKKIEFDGDHMYGFRILTKKTPGDLYLEEILSFINSYTE